MTRDAFNDPESQAALKMLASDPVFRQGVLNALLIAERLHSTKKQARPSSVARPTLEQNKP